MHSNIPSLVFVLCVLVLLGVLVLQWRFSNKPSQRKTEKTMETRSACRLVIGRDLRVGRLLVFNVSFQRSTHTHHIIIIFTGFSEVERFSFFSHRSFNKTPGNIQESTCYLSPPNDMEMQNPQNITEID